ncbi:hypothetical protein B296_00022367 [Ensete ventricosum]|uniref:Uncharacterized protein n=1 Tax=Ensete ventricosum TaxID=4639 RepID=A0A426XJP5_ENSVE|nr:hypothetical protein B296_00022367 [Ensete ventricosum]
MQLPRGPFVALHLRRCSVVAESKSVVKALVEIRHLSKQDPKMCAPLVDANVNVVTALFNLFIYAHEALMCTSGILNALTVAIQLLSPSCHQHVVATLSSIFFVETYRSIIGSKKSLIIALVDLLKALDVLIRSIKDMPEALLGLTFYPLNYITPSSSWSDGEKAVEDVKEGDGADAIVRDLVNGGEHEGESVRWRW